MLADDATSGPGSFSTTFEVEEDKVYTFEISPRGEGYASSAMWDVLGDAVQANLNDNTGYFKITLTGRRGSGGIELGASLPICTT